ncbi:cupin domain-containing protein [Sphingomonas sp. OK281]|uniref:cupin domain-containing protein n=1 Tax=Sphingomonas sp. OK281 TaxID=1881067 RepID=UPI0008EBA29E|nr:cupin domain-containing protein [Sphingomonas sp. OK281]SFO48904.1 Cupin domain-containing protein [Sphingomonas sp. OK281]
MSAEYDLDLPIVDIYVGPIFTYRTPVLADQQYCVADVSIPNGVTVPIHSHDDRETFYILSGKLEGYLDGAWHVLQAGDVFDVMSGARHALRNASGQDVSLILITTIKLGQFFIDVGRAKTGSLPPPTPADMLHFVEVSQSYGYWMGDNADNAAIGIVLN